MPTPLPPFRSVGDFIRSQRELMSLSMRQLAEMAQVSNPYLSQIERGVYKPSAQVLKGIADALDMSAETLYREAGLLDDSVERPVPTVEDAIRVDPRLTQEGKQALIQVYQGLIAAQPAAAAAAAPMAPSAGPARKSRSTAPARRSPSTTTARKSATAAPARKSATAAPARTSSSTGPARKSPSASTSRKPAGTPPARKAAARSTSSKPRKAKPIR
jgi:transcriptional regulator with XRE-family HTH domain